MFTIKKVDSKYEIRFREGGRDTKAVKRRFDSIRECKEFYFHYIEELENKATTKDNSEILFKDEFENWLVKKPQLSKSHKANSRRAFQLLDEKYPNISMDKFTQTFINDYQQYLAKKFSKRTVDRYMTTISSVFNFSLYESRINFKPFKSVPKFNPSNKINMSWEYEDGISFLNYSMNKYQKENFWVHIVYELALNCGLRANEIWGLEARHIKFNDKYIQVEQQALDGAIAPPKWGSARKVPVNDDLLNRLQKLVSSKKRYDPIFTNEAGNRIDHRNFYKRVFVKDIEAWGGPMITFHALRHFTATQMLNAGISVYDVKEVLGHKDIQTTSQYLYFTDSRIKQIADKFKLAGKLENHLKVIK